MSDSLSYQAISDSFDINKAIETMKGFIAEMTENIDGYQDRVAQKQMVWEIIKTFAETEGTRTAIIEAPTGTGKSIGYLLPFLAIRDQYETVFSNGQLVKRKPRMCVSTNTIALQEQLIEKDIPMLKKALGVDFTAALIKGRRNYICDSKINKLSTGEVEFKTPQEIEHFKMISKHKDVKDREDFPKFIDNMSWMSFSAGENECTGQECPFYEDCAYYKQKSIAMKADVSVVNHTLLLLEEVVEHSILPPHDILVVDEAHNLPSVATDLATKTVTKGAISSALKGTLEHSHPLTEKLLDNPSLLEEYLSTVREIMHTEDMFFSEVTALTMDLNEKNPYRVIKSLPPHLVEVGNLLLSKTKELSDLLHRVEIKDLDEEDWITEKNNIFNKFSSTVATYGELMEGKRENEVHWFQRIEQKSGVRINLCIAPVFMDEFLGSALNSENRTVILTSATMGTKNDLSYMAKELGLRSYTGKQLQSPFDYKTNALLYIPNGLVSPQESGFDDYIAGETLELINTTKGKTLVLFTSYSSLNYVYEKLQHTLKLSYTVFKQGEDTKKNLLEKFQSDENSILFATSSFWEGVDIQGESLISVILTKLPFESPDSPMMKEKFNILKSMNKNSFTEETLPAAIMKFKQGHGRLIRTNKDYGVVSILDNRINTKRYGKNFIESLPFSYITNKIDDVEHFLENVKKQPL